MIPQKRIKVLCGVRRVARITCPIDAKHAIKVPGCHAHLVTIRALAVVYVIVHILAMVVGGQEQVYKKVVVAQCGKIEVIFQILFKVCLRSRAYKVHGIIYRLKVYCLFLVVGILCS